MDIDKILLTQKEINEACKSSWESDVEGIINAQCLKLLKVLEDDGEIEHEYINTKEHGISEGKNSCWLCKLKALLEG